MTGGACNGWVFWSVQGTETAPRASKPKAEKPKAEKPAKEIAPAKAKAPPTTRTGAKAKSAKKARAAKKPKAKAMRAKATDVASYGCGACGATFGSQKAAVAHALTHTS